MQTEEPRGESPRGPEHQTTDRPRRPEDAVQDPDDPAPKTEQERAREVADILATGYLRCRALRARGAAPDADQRSSDEGVEEPRRQPENEVDASRQESVHPTHADGSAPAAEQEVLG